MSGVHKRWLNTGICNTTWNEWQIICACIDNSTMKSFKKCVPSFLNGFCPFVPKKDRKRKKEVKHGKMWFIKWHELHSRTLHESSMGAKSWAWSYRKKGKEGEPTYSKYLPLPIVTHFMFLLPEACFGIPKIQRWMFSLPNTPHSSYLPLQILSHIKFVIFVVREACFCASQNLWMDAPTTKYAHAWYLSLPIVSHLMF